MEYSINMLLCLEKNLKQRLAQLRSLESESAKETSWMEPNKVEKPTYDIKMVDRKIVNINKALFQIDMKVKESNAVTKIEMKNFDYDGLMSAID